MYVQDTGRVHCEWYVCYLARGSLSKGFFGATEGEALWEAAEATESGRFSG